MQTSFFVALISLAVFVQAVPTPQLPPPVGALLGGVGGVGGLVGGLGGAGSLTGGLTGGITGGSTGGSTGGGAAGADGGAGGEGGAGGGPEARSINGPLIWKRQGVDPGAILAGVTGAGADPAAILGALTGAAGGNTPAKPKDRKASEDEA